jgi:acyl-coenzyme A synthetase/AMP-(fatty) acid ligase
MDKLFFYNQIDNENITYRDLIMILNGKADYHIGTSQTYGDIFINIIRTLLQGKPVTGVTDMILKIRRAKDWNINLYTSGTTGIPKKVTHSFDSLTREIKVSRDRAEDIWGLAYNPMHMAGLQVFFQALLNGNSIINLFKLSKKNIYKLIEQFNITHISATATFYRQLLPCNKIFPSIKQITFGGEKYSDKVSGEIKKIFPNARILNIYASTEAGSLFTSNGDIFWIKDRYIPFVRVVDNELLIHKDILGEFGLSGDWYHTGDMVEIININPLRFRFVARKNEIINVGGYNVSPHEVEEIISKYPKVKNVVVYGKPNSVLGNIICADIEAVASIGQKNIRLFLKDKLADYKIPRIINFVDKVEMTETGKVKRI